jgi:hypothetical protein
VAGVVLVCTVCHLWRPACGRHVDSSSVRTRTRTGGVCRGDAAAMQHAHCRRFVPYRTVRSLALICVRDDLPTDPTERKTLRAVQCSAVQSGRDASTTATATREHGGISTSQEYFSLRTNQHQPPAERTGWSSTTTTTSLFPLLRFFNDQ